MKYFSMFSGIGGFEYGIQNASNQQFTEVKQDRQGGNRNTDEVGHDVLSTSGIAPLCIGYSEIDKYAIQVYEKHFKHTNYGDATKINPRELPDFDLLVGGFPCQAFSIAGKRKGFDDTRGTLFFDIARILAEKKPRLVVLENVKGLLSHEGGKTFQTIIGVLTDLGYFVEWQVLNSKNFGVPQNRERVFIVGYLGGEPGRKVFPITGGYSKTKGLVYAQKAEKEIARIHKTEGVCPTLHLKTGGWQEPKVSDDDLATVRRLTPVECERLQGFPDNWTQYGADTKELVTYKKCGNIDIWNKALIEKIKGQNVRFKIVTENKKPISVIASCTTSDGNEMEQPSCQKESSSPNLSVHIVIDKSEESERWECVINTIRCGDSTMTRYTLRKNESNQVEMAISEIATGVIPTPKSWKPILEENSEKTKSYTISTQINWIIESLISTYANAQSMELSMHNSESSSKTESTWEVSYLKTVNTEKISDSSRYKMMGNAVTTNVITYLFSKLLNHEEENIL